MKLPVMPPTADRAPFSNDPAYKGYLEGNGDWADANSDAVTWLADNHAAIRARLEGALTERQIRALDWILTCQIEQTTEWSPAGQPDQVVEQVCDIASVVELLPAGELRDRLNNHCEEIRREAQVRLDQVLAEEAKPKRPIDYIATAASYDFRVTTREEFEAATDRPAGLKERAARHQGTHILWDPQSDEDGFLLVGNDPEALAQDWFDGSPDPELKPVYKGNTFEAVVPVTSDMIFHQLISAFEGGSTYWAESADVISPTDESIPNPTNLIWWGRTKTLYEGEFEIHVTEQEEHKEGAGRVHKLTPETVQRGIQVMSSKYPRHFTAMIEENGDASTGDVFLQCCLFGDLIYG